MVPTSFEKTDATCGRFFHWIETVGWRARVVPVSRLRDLRHAIVSLHETGEFDESFYRGNLTDFSFEVPAELPGATSIIILAVPTPPMRVFFHWHGKRVAALLPPTYVSYSSRTEAVQLVARLLLESEGYGAAKTNLPLKTLAVRSGLADQGRNNLCYVPGMGSFLQLVALFTTLPCNEDPWREPKMLSQCADCVSCLTRCPSAAINEDRFMLHAERCLTLYNESTGALPDWIMPTWHNCLVGCMRCQDRCPGNSGVSRWVEDRVEFTEAETAALLRDRRAEELPESLTAKLRSLKLNYDEKTLGRNLAALIRRVEGATA